MKKINKKRQTILAKKRGAKALKRKTIRKENIEKAKVVRNDNLRKVRNMLKAAKESEADLKTEIANSKSNIMGSLVNTIDDVTEETK